MPVCRTKPAAPSLSLLASLLAAGWCWTQARVAFASTAAARPATPATAQTLPSSPQPAVKPSPYWQMTSYAGYKQVILNLIGRARQSIWLASRAIGDGDITSALYMARYRHRNLQIYIVLSRDELNGESQYPQMQREHFSLAFVNSSFFAKAGSQMMIDGRLYMLSTPLHNLGAARTHTIIQATYPEARDFIARFRQPFVAGDFLPPLASNAAPSPAPAQAPSDIRQYTKTYNYQKDYAPPPADVARQLPKAPKWQKGSP